MVSRERLEEMLERSDKWHKKHGVYWNADNTRVLCFWMDKLTIAQRKEGGGESYEAEYLNGKNLSVEPWGFYVRSEEHGWEVIEL
jgi:hypothetical protein